MEVSCVKRNTIQRSLTLEAVKRLRSHPTAEEIYECVSAEQPTVSRATVYRNLRQLVSDGEIISVELPCGASHFDHRCDRHYHAVCLGCGRVFDVDMDYIPDFADRIRGADGFSVSGYELIFKGVCAQCGQEMKND